MSLGVKLVTATENAAEIKTIYDNTADAIRSKIIKPNLLDVKNAKNLYGSGYTSVNRTENGVSILTTVTPDSASSMMFVHLDLGLVSDYANKTLCATFDFVGDDVAMCTTSRFVSCNADGSNRSEVGVHYTYNGKPKIIATIGDVYTERHLALRLYVSKKMKGITYEFNNIMVAESSNPEPYIPYGYVEPINAQDFADKVDGVYDKGRTDEWSDFWDALQVNGTRTNYDYAFWSDVNYSQRYWNGKNFKPKYSMQPITANRMFRACTHPNIKRAFEDAGLVLDFSNSTHMEFCFQNTYTSELGVIDASSVFYNNLVGFACYANNLETIEKIILPTTGDTQLSQLCTNSANLKNIRFEGVIGQTVTFSYNPLTVESMKSIISCLKNYAGTENEGTKTVTFKETCWEALEASGKPFDDGLTDDETMTWKDYVTSVLGWLV